MPKARAAAFVAGLQLWPILNAAFTDALFAAPAPASEAAPVFYRTRNASGAGARFSLTNRKKLHFLQEAAFAWTTSLV